MPLHAHTSGRERVLVPAGSPEDVRLSGDPAWHLVPDTAPAEPEPTPVDEPVEVESPAQRRARQRAERKAAEQEPEQPADDDAAATDVDEAPAES